MQKTIFTLLLLFSVLFFSCIEGEDKSEDIQDYINVNDKLPEFTVKNIDGEELKSQEFTGHVTLLVFFVTTCPDCQKELPKIEQIWEELKDNPDFKLVAISRAESADVIRKFREKNQFDMPFYLDPDRQIFSLFANSTVPRVYLIDRENVVTWMAVEEMHLTTQQLKEKIDNIINNANQ